MDGVLEQKVDEASLYNVVNNNRPKKISVGKLYMLRIKPVNGTKAIRKIFKCVQKVRNINGFEVNVLIMKPIVITDDFKCNCLNKFDCERYHVKYEPGLVVYDMNLNWVEVIKKEENGQ